ncbi:unnamed protein product [Triticum turgidum subsp. durum]|uniref:UspA domain-containing protein n=1 Tax=Triticum turgidum subsp. durum TaxID=4567 RepID=A0A9R0WT23_TRITD|nr:unnamed protein product [Triticum turgidum subsp. durum]
MEESTEAAATASGVAPGAGGAEAARAPGLMKVVVVLHAQHRVDRSAAEAGLAYAPPTALDSMRRAQEENSRRAVARALDVCRQKQASATAAVVEGDPKEAICEAVEEMRADLLVLGSRGLGMVKRALLGSVSDYLAHHACCPVLIVKPPNKAHHK